MDPNKIELKHIGSEDHHKEDSEDVFYPERGKVSVTTTKQNEAVPKSGNIIIRFVKLLILSIGLFIAIIIGIALYVKSLPPYVEPSESVELGANARITLEDFGRVHHWQGKKDKISLTVWWDMVGHFHNDEFVFKTKENAKKFIYPKILVFPNVTSNRVVRVKYTPEEIANIKARLKVYKR